MSIHITYTSRKVKLQHRSLPLGWSVPKVRWRPRRYSDRQSQQSLDRAWYKQNLQGGIFSPPHTQWILRVTRAKILSFINRTLCCYIKISSLEDIISFIMNRHYYTYFSGGLILGFAKGLVDCHCTFHFAISISFNIEKLKGKLITILFVILEEKPTFPLQSQVIIRECSHQKQKKWP